MMTPFRFCLFATLILFGTACSTDLGGEAKYPTGAERSDNPDIYKKPDTIFGDGGLLSLGGNRDSDSDQGGGIGVNSFLWRASLDTVSFLPITAADPFGGTILTDWYTPIESEGERFKVNVFILGRQLRSDGVRVRVFKQKLVRGAWVDSDVADDTGRQLEDAILTRARQLRVAQLGQ